MPVRTGKKNAFDLVSHSLQFNSYSNISNLVASRWFVPTGRFLGGSYREQSR